MVALVRRICRLFSVWRSRTGTGDGSHICQSERSGSEVAGQWRWTANGGSTSIKASVHCSQGCKMVRQWRVSKMRISWSTPISSRCETPSSQPESSWRPSSPGDLPHVSGSKRIMSPQLRRRRGRGLEGSGACLCRLNVGRAKRQWAVFIALTEMRTAFTRERDYDCFVLDIDVDIDAEKYGLSKKKEEGESRQSGW